MAKPKKRVKAPVPIEARLKILDKCGIPRSRANEPRVKAAIDHYFREMRKIIEEPIALERDFPLNPPGAVRGSRVNSTITRERIIHDRFVR